MFIVSFCAKLLSTFYVNTCLVKYHYILTREKYISNYFQYYGTNLRVHCVFKCRLASWFLSFSLPPIFPPSPCPTFLPGVIDKIAILSAMPLGETFTGHISR